MGPKELAPLSLVALVIVGSLAGDKRIAETHPEPTVIVQVDGPSKYADRAQASNTLARYHGDGIIR